MCSFLKSHLLAWDIEFRKWQNRNQDPQNTSWAPFHKKNTIVLIFNSDQTATFIFQFSRQLSKMQACTALLHASRQLPPRGWMFPRYLLETESYLRYSLGRRVVSRATLSAPPAGHWVWGQERRPRYLPRSHFGNIRTETVSLSLGSAGWPWISGLVSEEDILRQGSGQ